MTDVWRNRVSVASSTMNTPIAARSMAVATDGTAGPFASTNAVYQA
jgi:hypothetical protein